MHFGLRTSSRLSDQPSHSTHEYINDNLTQLDSTGIGATSGCKKLVMHNFETWTSIRQIQLDDIGAMNTSKASASP
jgi:hypothetical protein